jgi:prefoldin alpha subunit
MTTAKNKPADEQQLQELYGQLQYINNQITELQKEAEAIDKKKQEFLVLSENLGNLDKVKKDANSFSDIGAGIYAKTQLSNTQEMLVNVGSNTFVHKPVKEIIATLQKQVGEFDKIIDQISQNMNILGLQAQLIQSEMQKSLGME